MVKVTSRMRGPGALGLFDTHACSEFYIDNLRNAMRPYEGRMVALFGMCHMTNGWAR